MVLAYLVSVDFGVYSALVALFAAVRSRALRELAIGVAAAAVVSLLVFAGFGFAIDFVRVNVVEIFGGHSVGFIGPLTIPDCLRTPAFLHHLPDCLDPIVWVIALITSCAALARSPLRARRSDGPWLIGVWIVVAAAAFVRRSNFQFNPAVTPFIVAAIWTLWRYARTVAIVLAVAVVLLAQPFRHVITVIPELRDAQESPLFDPTTAASISAARRFAATLKPDETFVDFASSGMLYSLLGRDSPLRQVEVANYQADEAQRAVIERIERNRTIRAALISFPGSLQRIDGLSNAERAPLVWAYLQRNFVPAFDENGVVFCSIWHASFFATFANEVDLRSPPLSPGRLGRVRDATGVSRGASRQHRGLREFARRRLEGDDLLHDDIRLDLPPRERTVLTRRTSDDRGDGGLGIAGDGADR